MEMDKNWSKPKVYLSLRDTQESLDIFQQQLSQNVFINIDADCLIYAISLINYLTKQLISLIVIK
jgi:hypothetical protein